MAPSEDRGRGCASCQAGSPGGGGGGGHARLKDLSHWEDDIDLLVTHHAAGQALQPCVGRGKLMVKVGITSAWPRNPSDGGGHPPSPSSCAGKGRVCSRWIPSPLPVLRGGMEGALPDPSSICPGVGCPGGWAAPLLLLPPCCGWAQGWEGGTRRAQSPRKSALGGTGIASTIHFVTKVIMCREMYG